MNIKDVENLAELARIELADEEKVGLLSDMEDILDYVKAIEKVKIKNVEIEYKIYNIWREDELDARPFSKKLIIGQFPNVQDGFLKVKKIL